MRMLAQRRITEALPALVRVLERERDTELQEAAALALRDIGDPEAVPPLTAGSFTQAHCPGSAPVQVNLSLAP